MSLAVGKSRGLTVDRSGRLANAMVFTALHAAILYSGNVVGTTPDAPPAITVSLERSDLPVHGQPALTEGKQPSLEPVNAASAVAEANEDERQPPSEPVVAQPAQQQPASEAPPPSAVAALPTAPSESSSPIPASVTPSPAVKEAPLPPQLPVKHTGPREQPTTQKRTPPARRERTKPATTSDHATTGASDATPPQHATASLSSGRGAAEGNFRSLVLAEINRRKRYPRSAEMNGIEGVVGVSFTIGPAGRVIAHTITRPSGNSELDEAVHQLMATISVPPPPGGQFSANVAIRFQRR